MTLQDWDEFNRRLYTCVSRFSSLPPHTSRDCYRMGDTVTGLLRLADQERVICRRRRTVTLHYERLMHQAEEALRNLEGHVIMATLMRKDQ